MMNSTAREFKNVSPDELYQVLIQEVNMYRSLAEVMGEMQVAIIKGDIDRLQMTTAREQSIVKKANGLTELRYAMLKHVYLSEGIKERPITIKNLITHSSGNFDRAWTEVDKQLHEIVAEIQRLNQENKRLLEVSLGFVRELIQRVYAEHEKDMMQLYSRDGSVSRNVKDSKHLDVNI